METNNIRAIRIDLWLRASTKDFMVTGTLYPRKGGMHQFAKHVLPSKIAMILDELEIQPPPLPPKPGSKKGAA